MRLPIFLTILTLCNTGYSLPRMLGLTVEPIVGYEREQKLVPTQHTKDRLVYGGRVTAGLLLLKAEAEYTRGTDTESFSDQDLTTKDTADKLKVGLRGGIRIWKLATHVRAGAQAKQNRHEETIAGETTVTVEPIKYHPYAGAGLRFNLARRFSLTADVVAVFTDFPTLSKTEYQTTAGFVVSLP